MGIARLGRFSAADVILATSRGRVEGGVSGSREQTNKAPKIATVSCYSRCKDPQASKQSSALQPPQRFEKETRTGRPGMTLGRYRMHRECRTPGRTPSAGKKEGRGVYDVMRVSTA
jgi:hypothetical protein